MKAEAICGKTFEVEETEDTSVETLCRICGKDVCMIYVQYVYEVTHYNNPR